MIRQHAHFLAGKSSGGWTEDALSIDTIAGRAAVADGVSNDSLLSGPFAQFLADYLTASPASVNAALFSGVSDASAARAFDAWCAALAADWGKRCKMFLTTVPLQKEWAKFHRPSCSTLAGVQVTPPAKPGDDWILQTLVVGDSGVLLIDRGHVRVFTQRDDDRRGVSTNTLAVGVNGAASCAATFDHCPISPDARIYLMSDAVLDWCLDRTAGDPDDAAAIKASLGRLRTQSDFLAWHRGQRHKGLLKDDDASVLVIGPEPDAVVTKPVVPPDRWRGLLDQLVAEAAWRPVRKINLRENEVEIEFEGVDIQDYLWLKQKVDRVRRGWRFWL